MNKQETQHNEDQENEKVLADGPSKKNLKKIISEAKQKGYITQDQLEELVISEKLSSEQIEDLMTDLSGMGINVTENEEAEYSEEAQAQSSSKEIVATSTETDTSDKTDDPVRMYLREMGSVELLSREGEIAIAKRIEAGRNLMINGLCESPLTFQAITIWRNELLNEVTLMAQHLASFAPFVPRTMKAMVHFGMEASLAGALMFEKYAQGALVQTEDKAEGIAAFLEKRTPEFKGK